MYIHNHIRVSKCHFNSLIELRCGCWTECTPSPRGVIRAAIVFYLRRGQVHHFVCYLPQKCYILGAFRCSKQCPNASFMRQCCNGVVQCDAHLYKPRKSIRRTSGREYSRLNGTFTRYYVIKSIKWSLYVYSQSHTGIKMLHWLVHWV